MSKVWQQMIYENSIKKWMGDFLFDVEYIQTLFNNTETIAHKRIKENQVYISYKYRDPINVYALLYVIKHTRNLAV